MEKGKKNNLSLDDKFATELPWRAWGSWFSWGSPVGLSLGYALFVISTGILVYLLHLAEIF
jgi:hypothetical protein